VGEVLLVCDAEIVVREVVLKHAEWRRRSADAEHGGGAVGTLRTPDLTDGGHRGACCHRRRRLRRQYS